MTLVATDITFTFSGGSSNSDPNASLGGESSSIAIPGTVLFSDVTPDQSTDGFIDYRCFYLHNENVSDSLYNAILSIFYTVPGDVVLELGFYENTERQSITVLEANLIASGSIELTYTDVDGEHDFTAAWDADAAVWAGNLQTAITAVAGLEDLTVSVSTSYVDETTYNLIFEIDFVGTADLRYHDLLVLKTNSLSPTTSVGISRSVAGGPINNEADEIDVSTTLPNGVTFIDAEDTFEIGELKPIDSVAVWVKRTVPAGTPAMENDGFTFRLTGNP